MKKILLVVTLCSLLIALSNNNVNKNNSNESKMNREMKATKVQKEGVEQAIEYYMEGGRQADGSITAKAFTENATMSQVEDGKLVSVPIQTLCDIVSKGKAEPASYEITALDVQEDIAIVHIESQFGDAKYYDMFSLVKDENGWKIVSKIYRNR